MLSERQVQRLKRRYQPDSVEWVQHGNRGRSVPWAVSLPQKQLILTLARGKYQGFNDSHLAEKLREEENLIVSRETVRRILRVAKVASPQRRRPRKYRSRRAPHPRFGMMVLTGRSANLISIGAIDFGILVDSSIIVLESIYRKLTRRIPGEDTGDLIVEGLTDAGRGAAPAPTVRVGTVAVHAL